MECSFFILERVKVSKKLTRIAWVSGYTNRFFGDTKDIISKDSIYYAPYTATLHVVYIFEESIIQFEGTAYLIDMSKGSYDVY